MGETLFGGEVSGTPIETRRGTEQLAGSLGRIINQGAAGAGRMSAEAVTSMLGFDPRELGLQQAAVSALMDPADRTAGLFASLRPFERDQTRQQVAGLRDMFGTMGGRFSRNVMEGESDLRSNLADSFLRTRQEGLLQAGEMRNRALASLLGATISGHQQANQNLRTLTDFFRPGAPQQKEGILPGIIGAGTNIAGALLTGGASAVPSIAGAVGSGMGGTFDPASAAPTIFSPRLFQGARFPFRSR